MRIPGGLRPARALLLTLLLLLSTEGAVAANGEPQQSRGGAWRDALGSEEKERALGAVRQRNPGFERRAVRGKVFRNDRPALLLIEKRPQDKNAAPARLADAYYYDYQRNETIHCIVDAKTGEVHRQERVTNLQLPLTQEEIRFGFDVLLQSPKHRRALADAYFNATGQSLIDINRVHYKAYVFHASANSARLNTSAKHCGRIRCAQMLLYTDENIALNMTPVIDISRGKVLQGNTEPAIGSTATHPDLHEPSGEALHDH